MSTTERRGNGGGSSDFIGIIAAAGPLWYLVRGRHQVGTLPEHMAQQLEADPTLPPPEGSQA